MFTQHIGFVIASYMRFVTLLTKLAKYEKDNRNTRQ
nr:MAG TPA: hypothetical protein [Caudoviricetes sp.]DAW52615.1 MAG TPA: hypothetical protein [Caudoviricetes sp.]